MRPKKKVKLKDIADALDVSVVTVSNALAGRKGVSASLREEIEKKAAAMGYPVSMTDADKHTVKTEPRTVGCLIMKDRSNSDLPWMTALTDCLVQESENADIRLRKLSFHSSGLLTGSDLKSENQQDIQSMLSAISDLHPDGLIVCGTPSADLLHQLLIHVKIPVVCCGFFNCHEKADYVLDDGFHNMQLVYDLLSNLGHSRISIVCGTRNAPEIDDHYLGASFQNTVRHKDDAMELPAMQEPETCTIGNCLQLAKEGRTTAAVCTDSETASALMGALENAGFRVPGDISVTGYSMNPGGSGRKLTEIVPDIGEIAKQAVKLLSRRMNKRTQPSGVRPVTGLLLSGTTVGPVKGGGQ